MFIGVVAHEPIHSLVKCHKDMFSVVNSFCCPDLCQLFFMELFGISLHFLGAFINIRKRIQRSSKPVAVGVKGNRRCAADKNRISGIFHFFCKSGCFLIEGAVCFIKFPEFTDCLFNFWS